MRAGCRGSVGVRAREGHGALPEQDVAGALGFDQVEREILPRFTPAATAAITGLPIADIETFARMYGEAKTSFIRIGFGLSRFTDGGQNLRQDAVAASAEDGVDAQVAGAQGGRNGPIAAVAGPQLN